MVDFGIKLIDFFLGKHPLSKEDSLHRHGMQETSEWNQLKVLISRGFLKSSRDAVSLPRTFYLLGFILSSLIPDLDPYANTCKYIDCFYVGNIVY